MDVYKQLIDKDADDKKIVKVGRLSAAIALIIGATMAPLLVELTRHSNLYKNIQEL